MKEVELSAMSIGEWYYIESVVLPKRGSGRQIGHFIGVDGRGGSARFSKIVDITRPDGTIGRSSLSSSGHSGLRHHKWFRFYRPMVEPLMRQALARRFVCKTHQIDCDIEQFIN